jgi:hypothetical protein
MTGPLPLTNLLIAGSTSLCKGDSVILSSNNYEAGTRYDWSNLAFATKHGQPKCFAPLMKPSTIPLRSLSHQRFLRSSPKNYERS